MMRRARVTRLQVLTLALSMSVFVAGCDDDDGEDDGAADDDGGDGDGDGDGDLSACDFDDHLDWDGTTYENGGPGHESLECEPFVEGYLLYADESIFPEGPPMGLVISAQWGKVPTQNFPEIAGLRVFMAGVELEEGSSLPFGATDQEFTVIDAKNADEPRYCTSMVGEATITRLPDQGEYVEGTYTVSAWSDTSDAECPTPATGTFSFDRFN